MVEVCSLEMDYEARVVDFPVRVSSAVLYSPKKISQGGDISWAYGGYFLIVHWVCNFCWVSRYVCG